MQRFLAAGLAGLTGLVVLAFVASPAVAGGWAVTTLDSVPTPHVGEEVAVGFTIRQHGVSPVQPEGDVGIEIRSQTGSTQFFPGRPSGPTGHYVASVVFPDAGTFTMDARQGWFAPQPLGTVAVDRSAAVRRSGGEPSRWPAPVRVGLLIAGGSLLGFALFDAVRARGRGPAPVAP